MKSANHSSKCVNHFSESSSDNNTIEYMNKKIEKYIKQLWETQKCWCEYKPYKWIIYIKNKVMRWDTRPWITLSSIWTSIQNPPNCDNRIITIICKNLTFVCVTLQSMWITFQSPHTCNQHNSVNHPPPHKFHASQTVSCVVLAANNPAWAFNLQLESDSSSHPGAT